MTAINLSALQAQNFCVESPVSVVEGVSVTFSVTFWGAATTGSAIAYRNRTNVSATVFPAGSVTNSGNVITLKPATGLIGGSRYVIAVTATVAANVWVKKFTVIVSKDEAE